MDSDDDEFRASEEAIAEASMNASADVFEDEEGGLPTPTAMSRSSRDPLAEDFLFPTTQMSGSRAGNQTPSSRPRTPSMTPLVAATPRTQIPQHNRQNSSSPQVRLPRGDMGRSTTTRAPATPRGWNSSQTDASFDQGHETQGNLDLGNIEPSVIWGTNINIDHCMNMFTDFIENFCKAGQFEPHYIQQLTVMHRDMENILNIDCSDILAHSRSSRLYSHLIEFPHEIIPVFDKVINERIFPRLIGEVEYPNIQVRTYGLKDIRNMRDLDPNNIDQLISIKGMVVRCSSIIPDLKQAFFQCVLCPHTVEVIVEKGRIDEPSSCSQCNNKECMQLVHNRSLYADKQLIRLQESVDEIPEGETPQTVTLFAFDNLVDTVRPGDRIIVTGVFRAIARKANPRVRTLLRVYKTYLDVVHMQSERDAGTSSKSMDDEDQTRPKYSDEQVAAFKQFSQQADVYDKLVSAFAPSIWEMDDVKKGVLCQLFGGTLESLQESQRQEDAAEAPVARKDKVRLRGDINILLCGDPGTSKSQILSYVHKMSPRGIYTSGKGSSAVGLTASVVRDPETKDSVLESGALVLSDRGICCIDEFDKMSDITRAILHEAMEQQTVSITKAGIIATLNARTAILASANPVESRYNSRLSVVENIKLPPTLLSRFDLIYLILDKPNPETDRRLARHLVSLYYSEADQTVNGAVSITQEFLRNYITYGRTSIAPELSADAGDLLVEGYLEMRAMGNRGTKTISATPRQLESLIRLSQALAKMTLSRVVTPNEVREAVRLMRVATQAAATDPRTGTIDMDLINTGRTAIDRDLVHRLTDELRRQLDLRRGQRITLGQLREILSENSDSAVAISAVEEAVRELASEGLLQFNDRTSSIVIR